MVVTYQYHFYGWDMGGLKKTSLLILSSVHFNSSTTQTEIVGAFFKLLFLHLSFTSCKFIGSFWLSSKLQLQIISECGNLIQKVMFHFNSSTCVQVHISLVDPASNSFFKANTKGAHVVHMESGWKVLGH